MPGPVDTALVPSSPASLSKVNVALGVVPTTVDEGWRLATVMAKSSLVPKAFANKPEDVFVAIQLGVEIGFAPMQALQSIAVINGRPSVWGDGFLALIMASAIYQDHQEFYEVDGVACAGLTADDLKKDTTTAVCTFWRRGRATAVTQRFSIAQAKKANLWSKAGPWQEYPDRMLKMRARSWAGRDAFPDLLRGLRTAEEVGDESTTHDPVDVRTPRRLSDAPAQAAPVLPSPKMDRSTEDTGAAETPATDGAAATGVSAVAPPESQSPAPSSSDDEVKCISHPTHVLNLEKLSGTPMRWALTTDTGRFVVVNSKTANELLTFKKSQQAIVVEYVVMYDTDGQRFLSLVTFTAADVGKPDAHIGAGDHGELFPTQTTHRPE
jgi:hypothetical protein